jgi:5'-3' exonuclease
MQTFVKYNPKKPKKNKMGIRNLQHWIRWSVPQTVQSPDWSRFSGQRIGVDILGFLYRAKACGVYPIVYTARMIAACKRLNITLIVVFDGKPPSEKQKILEQRTLVRNESRIKKSQLSTTNASEFAKNEFEKLELNSTYFTSEERDQVKQFLYSCGVLSLNASGEADNVLAYFSRKGWISAVMSSDFDLLARGVENLIVPDGNAVPGEPEWKQYTLSNMLLHSDMNYTQFAEMCVLMGSDYTAGLRSIPFKTAYWTVKHSGSIEYTLARYNIRDISPFARAKQILTGVLDTEESLMNPKQWEKLHNPYPNVEVDTLMKFANVYFPELTYDSNIILNILLPGNTSSYSLFDYLSQNTGSLCNYTAASA